MFIRASAVLFPAVTLARLATAAPNNRSNLCGIGSLQCCSSVQSSDSAFASEFFGLLGLPPPSPGPLVGFDCFPITPNTLDPVGTCTSYVLCCTGDTFGGAIVTGCSIPDA